MNQPKVIKLDQIADVIAERFRNKQTITCYVGSNAATPTASIEALTEAITSRTPHLPYLKMVHLLLQGPVPYVERGLQDRVMAYSMFSGEALRKAANEGLAFYLPCTLANIECIIGENGPYKPDVAFLKVSKNPLTGEYSMGLSVEALHTAIDHARIVIAELDETMPFTCGQSILNPQSIDYIIKEGIKPVFTMPEVDYANMPPAEKRIGELIANYFIRNGATIQTGIGRIPDAAVFMIENAGFRDLGVQTELYSDGLMRLEKAGIINNRKKKLDLGCSTTSLIMGSQALYDFVYMRASIQMKPCTYTNATETIRANSPFISINTAMGVDLFGNVWADFISSQRYYSGVGGQPDFIRALNSCKYGTPIIAIKSVTERGESKIAKAHPEGIGLTASPYDGVVIVTEYGIADLRALTAGEKALAIAHISHPNFREEYLRFIRESRIFTKPLNFSLDNVPAGVIPYDGNIII